MFSAYVKISLRFISHGSSFFGEPCVPRSSDATTKPAAGSGSGPPHRPTAQAGGRPWLLTGGLEFPVSPQAAPSGSQAPRTQGWGRFGTVLALEMTGDEYLLPIPVDCVSRQTSCLFAGSWHASVVMETQDPEL